MTKKKSKRLHPLEIAARNASFDILGWIVERFKKAKENGRVAKP